MATEGHETQLECSSTRGGHNENPFTNPVHSFMKVASGDK